MAALAPLRAPAVRTARRPGALRLADWCLTVGLSVDTARHHAKAGRLDGSGVLKPLAWQDASGHWWVEPVVPAVVPERERVQREADEEARVRRMVDERLQEVFGPLLASLRASRGG